MNRTVHGGERVNLDRPVKLALYHTVQGLSRQVVNRKQESDMAF